MRRISTLPRTLAGSSGPTRSALLAFPRAAACENEPSPAERLDERGRQARRLETVGQLSSGIAHDFNNLLAVILGNGEYLLEALPEGHPARADAESIVDAARRAAALTKQILALTRRQAFDTSAADLNAVVSGLEPMLRRVIGEDIELRITQAQGLGSVPTNPTQLEQLILNLAINARDAMPHGGLLLLETGTATSNPDLECVRRDYVTLTVTDTGCGMDDATLERAFEPFFTTKREERGTGLGLSTIHDIVERSGGHIVVESEPGRGSVFTIFLPEEAAESGAVRYGGTIGGASYRLYSQFSSRDSSLVDRQAAAADSWNSLTSGFRVDWAKGADSVVVEGGLVTGEAHPLWRELASPIATPQVDLQLIWRF